MQIRTSVRLFLLLLLICTALLLPTALFAQATTGSITGTISDDQGAGVPGVSVTAKNLATGASRDSVSMAGGTFTIDLLIPGTYSIATELSGFQPTRVERVVVSLGTATHLTLKVRVGVSENLTVTAAAPVVETRWQFRTSRPTAVTSSTSS
jgi:hypothetical protein